MSYGYQPSLPEIVIVSKKVMDLNIRLRDKSRENKRQEWKELAIELYKEIDRILQLDPVDIRSVTNKQQHEIPLGRIENPEQLRLMYRQSLRNTNQRNGYSDFTYKNIQSRLACYHCLNEWMNQYNRYPENLTWENRFSIDLGNMAWFSFIGGYASASNNSINISLNKGDYAVHPQRINQSKVGGYQCTNRAPLGHDVDSALLFSVEDGGMHWEKILLLRYLEPEGFPVVKKYAKSVREYVPNETYVKEISARVYEEKIHSLIEYTALESNSNYEFRRLKRDEINKSFADKFGKNKFVILQRICRYGNDDIGGKKYLFKIHNSTARVMINYDDFAAADLGLFILTKDKLFDNGNSDRYFTTPRQQEHIKMISNYLGWGNSIGQIHQFNPTSIELDSKERDSGNLRYSSIKYEEKSSEDSEFIARFREKYPDSVLPTVDTAIKSISVFYFDKEKLERIRPKESFSIPSGDGRIFIRANGFAKPELSIIIKKANQEKAIHTVEPSYSQSKFWSFKIPKVNDKSNTNLQFIVDCVGKDNVQDMTRFSITNLPLSVENSLRDLKFNTSVASNKEILRANVRYQLKSLYDLSDDSISDYFFDNDDNLHYTELVKIIFQNSMHESTGEYSLPITKLDSIFPGLDELIFNKENTEPLSGRFRSTGIFLPKEDNSLEKYDQPNYTWSHFDEHIVKLSNEWYLLFTPEPLIDYVIEPGDDNVIVTNHGTFLRNSIPRQFDHIEKRHKPMFLDHISESPKQHINSIINLFSIIPENHLLDLKRELDRNFKAELYFTGSNTRGLKDWNGNVANDENWATCSVNEITDLPLSKYCLKVTLSTGKVVCLDILRVKHKMTNERRLIIRCIRENQSCDYLDIAKVIPNKQYMESIVPEWITIIKNQRIVDLHQFLNQTCSKYDRDYSVRAYDWHYIAVESLRSFVALNSKYTGISQVSHIGPFRTEISRAAPEPLRKYLLGGGKYDKRNKKNTDNMGGALNQPVIGKYPSLKKAFLSSIAKWIWLGNSD